jgi:hypothetical protein
MTAAVENGATFEAQQVRQAGSLSTFSDQLFARAARTGLAKAAVDRSSESPSATLGLDHPRTMLEWRTVANVPLMAARKLCDPLA